MISALGNRLSIVIRLSLRFRRFLFAAPIMVAAVIQFNGCATVVERDPVPEAAVERVTVLGRSDLRFRPLRGSTGVDSALSAVLVGQSDPTEQDQNDDGATDFLAISGGGANGAFAAGLLAGWTASGTRPEFAVVSGVSTGALAAPFAFLGPDYDGRLRELYTGVSTRDVAVGRRFFAMLGSDALADSEGLRDLIALNVDAGLLAAIAREHARGRRLFVATTDLDAGEPVIWDLGRIASTQHSDSLALFRDVLLASASIPVAFPPVYIPVGTGGRHYREMHVDGGASTQVFVLPGVVSVDNTVRRGASERQPRVWVIRNSREGVAYETVKPRILPIAKRSVDLLVKTQGFGDLYRIFLHTLSTQGDFNLALIPEEFAETADESFDPVYMRKLYDLGYESGAAGYAWRKTPPGYHLLGGAVPGAPKRRPD